MGAPPPQRIWEAYVGAIDNTWKPYIDASDTGSDFLPIGFKIVNLSDIIIQYSFDGGVTVAGEIDPDFIQAEVFDNACPPGRIMYLKADSGTPRVAAAMWA
jgi:hypothetical protein